jgi:CDP-diacylglycerol--serine O-phosphatidyltransferase
MAGRFRTFYILYFLVSCMDSLDGFAAKKLNQCTELGGELDSLCDGINFTLVPALFAIGLCGLSLPIVIGASAFAVCGILRLGYYNIITDDAGGFVGVPTTIASMFAMVFTWLFGYLWPSLMSLVTPALLLMALLMISRIRIRGGNFARIFFAFVGFGFLIMGLVFHKV